MLALEKMIAAFFTFPGLFLAAWGIVTFYLLIKKRSFTISFLACSTLLVMAIMFTGFGIKIFLIPLENYALKHVPEGVKLTDSSLKQDYWEPHPIVVLGGGIHYLKEGYGELNAFSLQRLVRAYDLYRRFETPIIYTGGVAIGQAALSEAEVAGAWLEKIGVQQTKIIEEDRARTTYENGLYIRDWLQGKQDQKIYLLTSAVHLKRASAVFHKLGIEHIPVPAGYLYSHQPGWLDYLPNRAALTANLSAVHEWLGIIWYRFRGRI